MLHFHSWCRVHVHVHNSMGLVLVCSVRNLVVAACGRAMLPREPVFCLCFTMGDGEG